MLLRVLVTQVLDFHVPYCQRKQLSQVYEKGLSFRLATMFRKYYFRHVKLDTVDKQLFVILTLFWLNF